jgi:hypothetical protein
MTPSAHGITQKPYVDLDRMEQEDKGAIPSFLQRYWFDTSGTLGKGLSSHTAEDFVEDGIRRTQ